MQYAKQPIGLPLEYIIIYEQCILKPKQIVCN